MKIEIETYAFGMVTGIAIAAVFQYIVSSFTYSPRSIQKVDADMCSTKPPLLPQCPVDEDMDFTETFAKLEQKFNISKDSLKSIVINLIANFKRGLSSDKEVLKMIPSYVTSLPSGNETGTYLALDLGGTNFRVCMVELKGNGKLEVKEPVQYTVSEQLKLGSGTILFDFFAECVANFCREHGIDQKKTMAMGFTFSFPLQQLAINSGKLVKWTKGFTSAGVEGKDVVELLQTALRKKGLSITVKAIINDTVGTLVAHAYRHPNTFVSVIFGTGTNAAYVEDAKNIPKWPMDDGKVIINTEWGAYDEPAVLPITEYDQALDAKSQNPTKQIFEKMISGMYLGELVRLVLCDLIKTGVLFNSHRVKTLFEEGVIETAHVSRIEQDHSKGLGDIKLLFEEHYRIPTTTFSDRQLIKKVCVLVGTRAARLSAAGIAALVTMINRLDGCRVAIDGSVYEHYPRFAARMKEALDEILGVSARNISLEQARDGSGQGAAITAALF